ncbi:class I SAM-dependent methyltransferase [Candidatus Parcubacteria bacterium]|nr:class I SAM-dependent methyltransferase [Candidatus Parcubacteria bacterium]
MAHVTTNQVADYYNTHQTIYNLFWSRSGLHYGFWEENTKNLKEAISNTDKFVTDVLSINSNDVVLDAGCGVGGSSLYVAGNTGAKVEGITLSSVQLKIAQRKASESNSRNLVNFSIQDFTNTRFKENTFSKVFGIECICYANDKKEFLNEAYRIIKVGGKIAVVDAFLLKENLNAEESRIYTKFIDGWRVPNLATKDEFQNYLEQSGFKNIVFYDKLSNIKKSSKKLYYLGLLSYPLDFIKSKLGIGQENFSTFYQKQLFEKIATYGVFVAEKLD